jgi:hypothetical protein
MGVRVAMSLLSVALYGTIQRIYHLGPALAAG